MRKILLLIGAILPLTTMGQTEVSVYTPGINAEGVTYFLPKTVVNVKIEAEKETYTPGDLCSYADKYLRLKDISRQKSVSWSLNRVEISFAGVADMNKAYTVKLKDKSVAPLVELSDDGVLLSINRPPSPKEKESVIEPQPKAKQLNPRDLLNEEILSVHSTAKMAELIAREIYTIRESKNAIVRGQADYMPQDGEAMKLMVNTLDEQDKALTSMFKGTVENEVYTTQLQLIPDTLSVTRQVLFRFSQKLGIVDADDLSGEPVYYDLTNLTDLPQPDEKSLKKTKRQLGIVYNLPGKVLLRIYTDKELLYEEELSVGQLGQTDVLPNALFNKDVTTKVTFDPVTGAIRQIDR